ncbi:MAG: outer membrane protein transport protein [Bacteroidetes bacterium]|nr:outer membrane protein transport protein [Bacteroidota bacterium]
MKKIFQLAAGVVFSSQLTFAQNSIDALRYSQLTLGGTTARSAGMAGSFGALGGDFSTLSANPAGIGLYRRSEFTFTPSFFNQTTSSNLNGTSLKDSKPDFNFGNIGIIVASYDPDEKNGWKGFSFGIGYNRINDFNNRIEMQGKNNKGSLLDVYLADANKNGTETDPYGTQLAWNTYLLNYDSLNNMYYPVLPNHGETQSKYVETSGSMGETVFSFGGNYDDKFYLGGTIGVPRIRYTESSQYKESMENDTIYNFQSFTLNQKLTTTGSGVNFKFGMIYKPVDWVRIGGTFHSPSYFNMHDTWNSDMSSAFTGSNASYSSSSQSPEGSFDYSLSTPAHAIGSVGFIIKKIGMINADFEYVDYASSRLHSSSYDFLSENRAISNKYTSTGNIRVGTEWRILNPMSIRAGIAHYGSPYKQGVGNDGSRISYTAGIGFREANFFMDFAYVFTQTKENYYFYDPSAAYVDPSLNTSKNSSLMMTFGFKF